MITEQHRKEGLSRAFIQAIAAKAGMTVSINAASHDYGIDGQFHKVSTLGKKLKETGINLDFQLKATTDFSIQEKSVQYSLDSSTYNMLSQRSHPRVTPAILILLCLPKDPREWFQISEKSLVLKNCCYWTRINSGTTSNTASVTIQIPTNNFLSPESLMLLMDNISLKDDWENH